jgi:thiosulfate dehydrogenase (quinone) large subunit
MTVAARFRWSLLRQRPLAGAGQAFALLLRYFMALFFVAASINKIRNGWAWTDYLHTMFVMRLDEIDPESFGAHFLENYGIPHYRAFGWMVTLGESAVAIGLTFGLMTRIAALGAMLLMFSFAIGGYYDASLIALGLMFLPSALLPTGHWLGLDRGLALRYPNSWLFR